MLTRRHALMSLAAFAAPPVMAAKRDPLTQAILANPIKTLDFPAGADPDPAIHAMFPQLIEQNFAARTNKGVSWLLASLSPQELHALAAAYNGATDSRGRLLDLLALRLTGQELGRLTPHFGHGPVYEAVWRSAPAKSDEFAQFAIVDVSSAGPPVRMGYGVNVGMTITEIYLTYRTAPIGALGVKAAVYETAMFAGRNLTIAWASGYAVGTAVSTVMQTYAPSLHESIGAGIYEIVNSVSSQSHTESTLGQAQATAALSFNLGYLNSMIASSGGDYGVCSAWSLWGGGSGGGGGTCRACLYLY